MNLASSVFLIAAIALFVPGDLQAATLNPGDLVVGENRSPPRISTVNPQTKLKTAICTCSTLSTVLSVAAKGTEKIYATGQLSGSTVYAVVAIDPSDGAQSVVSSGGKFTGLQGIALEADGSILVSNHTTAVSPLAGSVIRVNPSTGQQTVVSSGGRMIQSWGLAVGPDGQIFVAAAINFPAGVLPSNATMASGVVRIDPGNGAQTVVAYGDDYALLSGSTEIYRASDLTIDQAGDLFVLDKRFRGNNLEDEVRIIKVNPATGAQSMLNSNLKGVDRTKTGFDFRGIAVLNGVVYAPDYRLSETGLPGISRVDAAGGSRVGVTSEGFFSTSGLVVVPGGAAATSINFVAGWNLAGNGANATLDVASTFGDAGKISTVWKWIASGAKWAFYAPSLVGQALTDYAVSRGYEVLTAINSGEGVWVNAKTPFTSQLPAGTSVMSDSFRGLSSGWNLIAIGDNRTPREFNSAIGVVQPTTGVIPINVTALWAWDAALNNWYFYAPSLDQAGTLSSYAISKGYLDFGTNPLTPTTGFWVNKP